MHMRENKYRLMQDKLHEGLEKLEELSEDDTDRMGLVLIKLHGAMEDFVRLEVGAKAPQLREIVEDARQTNWKSLLDHAKTYLSFSEEDCRIITEANIQRQKVAHGGNYDGRLADLKRYARFVQKWCKRASAPADDWGKEQIIELHQPVPQGIDQPTHQSTYRPVPQPVAPVGEWHQPSASLHKPWYRSTLFLFVTFFLVPPLWALLILTDRSQGCLLRSFAALLMVLQVSICALVMVPLSGRYSQAVQDLWQQLNAPPAPTRVAATIPAEAPPSFSASPLPVKPESATTSNPTCNIVWVEGPADKLAGKNRSMVWLEIVQDRVRGSGMTSTQFYQFVVDHNPQLVEDGYEFKKGKTYYLPECQ